MVGRGWHGGIATNLDEYLVAYLDGAGLRDDPKPTPSRLKDDAASLSALSPGWSVIATHHDDHAATHLP
jgi:hypothetical protein